MATVKLLEIDQPDVRFTIELNRRIVCSLLLSNKTDDNIAFRLMAEDKWGLYYAYPQRGILLPRSTCEVEVSMLPQCEAPSDMECKDVVIVKSIVTFPGATIYDIDIEMFIEELGNMVDKIRLPVIYVPPTSIDRPINLKKTYCELLEIEPPEIQFPFELNKRILCPIFLSNKTDDYIAFKLLSYYESWEYIIHPNKGILLPRSTCKVEVTMLAQRQVPYIQRRDIFIAKSVVTFSGATMDDITHGMFDEESGNTVDEVALQVVYVSPHKPPSPVFERCDEGSSYWASTIATTQKVGNADLTVEQRHPRFDLDIIPRKLLEIDQPDIRFPFELNRRVVCSRLLSNKTDDHLAFMLLVEDKRYTYFIEPQKGILLPRSTCEVEVTMLPQREAPSDMQCKDILIVKSVVTFPGATIFDITSHVFIEESGNMVDECRLPIVYVSPTSIGRSIDLEATYCKLLEIEPPEIQFPFELNKRILCPIFLSNKTDDHIAFKLTMYIKSWYYIIHPNKGILLPRSTCKVEVTMLPQREAPDLQGKDMFIAQSVVTFPGATLDDITPYMFDGNIVDEVALQVSFVSLHKLPFLVPEGCDEGSLYWASTTVTSQKISNFDEESGDTVDDVTLPVVHGSPHKPPSPVPERCDEESSDWASAIVTSQKFGNFDEESGNIVDDVALPVVYESPHKPPSVVPESCDEASSDWAPAIVASEKFGNFQCFLRRRVLQSNNKKNSDGNL